MKLMLRSYSNLLLSVRRITQENRGKGTPGLDGQVALTSNQRVNLVKIMQLYSLWQVRPTKRVYIPKANGKQRPLGIPCIQERIAQSIVKNALEPVWEARFESHSYGFRPGRSSHDAIEQCFSRLRKGCDTWILDADIKGAFDHISHEFILDQIGKIPGRELIKQWLKAGYVEANVFHATNEGTPQGGTISPLLANIALDGMEKLLLSITKVTIKQPSPEAKRQKPYKKKSQVYGFIRFADDFLVTAKTKENIEAVIPILEEWLQKRGLELNWEKTNIVHVEQGCNFLGFNIRQFKGKCLCVPQKEKVKKFLQSIRDWLKNNPQVKTEAVINHLNPILRGWGNYYKHGVSKRIFSYVDSEIWKAIWRWCKRRHPKKGHKWVADKYFQTLKGRKWTFTTSVKDRKGRQKTLTLVRLADIPIERHIKVKGTASPDDSSLKNYWQKRSARYGSSYWEKGSKFYQVAVSQNWRCPVCGESLFNGEQLHTHHKIAVASGGTDKQENLIHLHSACHKHLHSGKHSEWHEA